MRCLLLITLIGCDATACPSHQEGSVEGMPCDGEGMCFVVDDFSSCDSAYYRCASGSFHFDHGLDPTDGASCADSPLNSCSTEGNDCSAEPTGGSCGCGSDRIWRCSCRCYGLDCPSCPSDEANGVQCVPIGNSCDYSGGHRCECVDTGIGAGIGIFQCTA